MQTEEGEWNNPQLNTDHPPNNPPDLFLPIDQTPSKDEGTQPPNGPDWTFSPINTEDLLTAVGEADKKQNKTGSETGWASA